MRSLQLSTFWLILLLLGGIATAQDATAQDDAAPTTEEAAPAATEPAAVDDDTPTPDANGDTDAVAAWETSLAKWKEILVGLRQLRDEYQVAEEDELDGIRTKYNKLLAEGEAMLPKLRKVAEEAFAAAPNEDRQLTRFMMKLVDDDVRAERYQSAYELSKSLIDHGIEDKNIYNLAGIAAFSSNHFDDAKAWFAKAEDDGSLSRDATAMNREVDKVAKLWKEELEFRAAEEKADDLPRVKLTTTAGDIVIELFENEAPDTVGNFISLVESGFYDGRLFHRVIPGFMAQTGCPKGDGSGGPGYKIPCEVYKNPHRNHFAGSLSMAHAGKDTGGSQFFITFKPTTHLNGLHTVFGRVIEGWDVLPQIARYDSSKQTPQPEPDKIVSVEVLRKRDHEYKPNKISQ